MLVMSCGGEEPGSPSLVTEDAGQELAKCLDLPCFEVPDVRAQDQADAVVQPDSRGKPDLPPNTEKCNGLDDNGDGRTDEEGALGCESFYADLDGDGFGTEKDSACLCLAAVPYTAIKAGDCDDAKPGINPAEEEICHNDEDEDCDGLLLPDCIDKACGPDGCGGACGSCPAGAVCTLGQCYFKNCQPQCAGKECGQNGCGGSCGDCPKGKSCFSFTCQTGTCQPDCTLKQCGDDGCGGNCPGCTDKEYCGPNGACLLFCTPNCTGKECGEDGCGGFCGGCPAGQKCWNYKCICKPDCNGKQCGDDGCGGICGNCSWGQSCNAGVCVDGLPSIDLSPQSPSSGDLLQVAVSDDTAWANVNLAVSGPCGPEPAQWGWVDSSNGPWTWHYTVGPVTGGIYSFTFTANSGAVQVHSGQTGVSGATNCW